MLDPSLNGKRRKRQRGIRDDAAKRKSARVSVRLLDKKRPRTGLSRLWEEKLRDARSQLYDSISEREHLLLAAKGASSRANDRELDGKNGTKGASFLLDAMLLRRLRETSLRVISHAQEWRAAWHDAEGIPFPRHRYERIKDMLEGEKHVVVNVHGFENYLLKMMTDADGVRVRVSETSFADLTKNPFVVMRYASCSSPEKDESRMLKISEKVRQSIHDAGNVLCFEEARLAQAQNAAAAQLRAQISTFAVSRAIAHGFAAACAYSLRRRSSITLQSFWRQYAAKMAFNSGVEKRRHSAAISIQSFARARSCAQRFSRYRVAAGKIKRWLRFEKQRMLTQACIALQARWRCFMASRSYKIVKSRNNAARKLALAIQSWQRFKRVQTSAAALYLQTKLFRPCAAKCKIDRKRTARFHRLTKTFHSNGAIAKSVKTVKGAKRDDAERMRAACVCIQSCFRKWTRMRKAACIIIQRTFARARRMRHENASIAVQRFWRKAANARRMRRIAAASCIRRAVLHYQKRKQAGAAKRIQSMVRSHASRNVSRRLRDARKRLLIAEGKISSAYRMMKRRIVTLEERQKAHMAGRWRVRARRRLTSSRL